MNLKASIKIKGAVIRSRAEFIERNEKNLKYFSNLEKRNFSMKCIKCLHIDNKVVTDESEILHEQRKFYEQLYSNNNKGNVLMDTLENSFLNNIEIPKLPEKDKMLCENPIVLKECSEALSQLKNNKSPGCDGFPVEFYKIFWNKIKYFVYDSYKWAFENKKLSSDQKRGIIMLIPIKGKDLCQLKSWRPISLLNIDYKILTKALAMRLQNVLNKIISTDQVGNISDRYMGTNIQTTADILNYCKSKTDEKALIAMLDFEKAFDSVKWSFLYQCLKVFNFRNSFISWVKTIYTDIESCVTNNGFSSNFFKLIRRIRQDCRLSALLFIIVAEGLAINLRCNHSIHGIVIENNDFKICQLADDTMLF